MKELNYDDFEDMLDRDITIGEIKIHVSKSIDLKNGDKIKIVDDEIGFKGIFEITNVDEIGHAEMKFLRKLK